MKPTTIRLPAELLDELDAEAEEHDFHTRTEYLRYLIDHRELVVSIALDQRKTRVDALADRVEELEGRLAELEAEKPVEAPSAPAETGLSTDGTPDDAPAAETAPATAGEGAPEPQPLESIPDLEADADADEPDALELSDPEPSGVEERARALDFFAPTREIRREREAAVVAAWEALVEYGELTREDFHDLVFDDHTAAFSSFDGWYDRLVVPALEAFEDVERADADTWRYVGEETDSGGEPDD